MLDMIVCGLMLWYHVDCVQFNFYNYNDGIHYNNLDIVGLSFKLSHNMGIMYVFDPNEIDRCGNSVGGHEYQRFHQNIWYQSFCNPKS